MGRDDDATTRWGMGEDGNGDVDRDPMVPTPARQESPLSRAKYEAYAVLLCVGMLACLANWLLGYYDGLGPFDAASYPALTFFCASLLAVVLRKGEQALRAAEAAGFAFSALFFPAALYHGLYLDGSPDDLGRIVEVSSWSPVVYLAAFSFFGARSGLAWSSVFYAALLAVGLPHALAGPPLEELQVLFHLYLSHVAAVGVLFAFAAMAESLIGSHALSEAARRQANTDFLTGLFDRRFVQEALRGEVEEADRYRRPLSLIMFDLDDFKRINDAYGHDAGDRVLKEVARACGEHLRKADRLGRWGGEEFLAPETRHTEARLTAERLKRAIEAHDGFGEVGVVTASFGVAAHREGDTPQTLLKRTDEALYRAKVSGKNRVEVGVVTVDPTPS